MREKVIMFISNHRPLFHVVTNVAWAIVLVVLVLLINVGVIPVVKYLPDFLLTDPALAETILSTLAGAWLTIMTFTFSTMMVVLTTYSSNYSPRIVENFLQQKTTMRVLGTFVGGFIYCISMLFFLNESFAIDRVLSSSVAVFYAFWCVIQFIVFIFTVGNAVQPQNLISALYREADQIIDEYVKSNKSIRTDKIDGERHPHSLMIPADASGYLEAVDTGTLQHILGDSTYRLIINERVGEFVRQGETLATLLSKEPRTFSDDDFADINRAFHLSNKQYSVLDYRYSIQKIVDVALRAISPGINDPNTAISCIHSLGLLVGNLSRVDGIYDEVWTNSTDGRYSEIIIENYSFADDLYTIFAQITNYGKTDISVVRALLDALSGAAIVSTEVNRKHLRAMGEYVYESAIGYYSQPMDIHSLEQRRIQLLHVAASGREATDASL